MLPQIGEQQKSRESCFCIVPPNPRSVPHANRSPDLASFYPNAFPFYNSGLFVRSSALRLLG